MRAKYDQYFSTMASLKKRDLSGAEKLKQLNRLREGLVDWGTLVFDDISFEWYINFEDHHMLPYPGSWSDQPRYVQQELHRWAMLRRFWEINEDLPSTEGIPTLEELINRDER